MVVRLEDAKEEARRSLLPGQPGRELLLAQPDHLEDATFDSLLPSFVRMLRMRPAEDKGSPAAVDAARGMEAAGGSGQPREP
jgi:hypothetical protein